MARNRRATRSTIATALASPHTRIRHLPRTVLSSRLSSLAATQPHRDRAAAQHPLLPLVLHRRNRRHPLLLTSRASFSVLHFPCLSVPSPLVPQSLVP